MSYQTDERVNQALDHNLGEVMRDGPRLTYTKQVENGARCPSGKHVLRCGLGAMGVGQMWGSSVEQAVKDPLWKELPVEPCMYGCSLVDEWPVWIDGLHGDSGRARWMAQDPRDLDVTYWVEDGALSTCDDRRYYPSGGYDIPLTVVDALRAELPGWAK